MVTESDAIVNPWTVMVVSVNTSMTYDAMSASWRSDGMTLWTEGRAVKELQKF